MGIPEVVSSSVIFTVPVGVSDNGIFCAPPDHVVVLRFHGYHHPDMAPRHKKQVISWQVRLCTDDKAFAEEYLWIQRRDNAGMTQEVYFAYDAFGPIA